MSTDDTIFALSSAPGRAGVAVIRVSGTRAGEVVMQLSCCSLPEPRRAVVRTLRSLGDGQELDRALVLWFPRPGSFTGEDIAEFHVHGGCAVVAAVLDALGSFEGLRLAEAGEFARRAFDNEKIGLTEAEGLADLIDAETEAQRQQALRQASGQLEALYEKWRQLLLEALGLVEAAIDFSDEGDVAADSIGQSEQRAEVLLRDISAHLQDGRRGEIVRDGFRVVLAGPPNAGKSSLLNALVKREAAIVSPEAGTTRDVIEVVLDLGGFRVVVSDTAGIRDATGAVEREGVRRTLALGRQADLVLWLIDATLPVHDVPEALVMPGVPVLQVWNKIDLAGDACVSDGVEVAVSALTGFGIDQLERRIVMRAKAVAGDREDPVLTQHRHREALEYAASGLRRFISGGDRAVELRAEDLRQASVALGRLVGRVDAEDVLGQIFGRFCIGK